MKKYIYKTIQAVCLTGFLVVSACNTSESEPLNWNTEEHVTNPKDSTALNMDYLFNAVYNSLPTLHTRLSDSYLDAATDDGVPTLDKGGNSSLENYRNGRLSAENIASLDGNAWTRFYTGIRRANLFLEKIEGYPSSTKLPEEEIVRRKAESRLLRAYFYFELMKRWGGVPLVGNRVINYDENWDIPRSSIDECAKYILDEISPDSPISCYKDLYPAMALPSSGMEGTVGRVNQGVALAIVSRLKLYLASPLYNKTGNLSKWQEAADAAQKVIDLGVYDLHVTTKQGSSSYLELFGETTTFPNKEIIMMREAASSSSLEMSNSPCGYYRNKCRGLTSPSQNLVDAFPMLDGKRIGESAKYEYDPQNPYVNRDPRLTYTVFYNGSRWLRRSVETFNGGLDRSNVPGLVTTQTGYYLRKFLGLNEERADNGGLNSISHNYQIFRYAEILLNYAEALNEVDKDANVDKIESCLISLRKRAGIEAGDNNRYGLPTSYSQEEMREIIRNERRIELAFEEHRFWDTRRWMIADRNGSVLTQPIKGVEIVKQSDGTLHYNYVPVRTSSFDERMYWYPIPRGEMYGNPNLIQNSGWNY